ncbi:MAG: AMP-binding protein [Gemmatimonas sp.]
MISESSADPGFGAALQLPNATLSSVWAANAARLGDALAVSHWADGRITHRYSWRDLFAEAKQVANWLRTLGVVQGQVCALLLRPDSAFYPLYMGVVLAGAMPSVVAYPNERLHPQKFRDGLQGMAAKSGLDWMLTDAELHARFSDLLDAPSIQIALISDRPWKTHAQLSEINVAHASPDDTCLLQHSSGTTGLQKGVALSHRAVLEHAHRYGNAIAIDARDSVASWLPLYHDMGLIAAFHVPLAFGIPIVQLDAFTWVVRPGELLNAIAHERATLCWLPNFAFNLIADRVRSSEIPEDACASMRLITSCSEPVRSSSVKRLHDKLTPFGLRPHSIGASFAMAETTFAITQTPIGTAPVVEQVSRAAIGTGVALVATDGEPARACVSSGRVIDGCSVRIVDGNGLRVADGTIGGIEVQSVSLFNGYRHNEAATARVFRDRWFVTGDVGYVRSDELFVMGREKDLIIVAGKNIYPEDVEDAVGRVDGVTAGRAVAFEMDDEQRGTGQVAVVVETAETSLDELKALRSRVARVGTDFDVPINHVFFAAPRWLIKSSSGKLSRKDNGARAMAELEDVIWKTT